MAASDFPSLRLDRDNIHKLGNTDEFGLVDSSFTIEVWIRPEKGAYPPAGPQEATILGSYLPVDKKNNQLHLIIRDRKPYFGFYNEDTTGQTVIPEEAWCHLAFRYDKAKQEQTIFVNGVKDAVGTNKKPFLGVGTLLVGDWGIGGYDKHFKGLIRDLRIWGSALSEQQIVANMYEEFTAAEGLVAVWKFNSKTYLNSLANIKPEPFLEQIYQTSSPQSSYREPSAVTSFQNNEGVIKLAASNPIAIRSSFCAEVWVNPSPITKEAGDSPVLFGYGDKIAFQLSCNTEGVEFRFKADDRSPKDPIRQRVSFQYAFLPNKWHHIAAYFNRPQNTIGILVNGILKATQEVKFEEFNYDAIKELTIGGTPFPHLPARFNGMLAELRLWGAERDIHDIQGQIYQELEEGTKGLFGYWKLDEDYGSKSKDSSGYGNSLELTNVVRLESRIPIQGRRPFNAEKLAEGLKNAWKQAGGLSSLQAAEIEDKIRRIKTLEDTQKKDRETIAKLEAKLKVGQSDFKKLRKERNTFEKRVEALNKILAEKTSQLEALGPEGSGSSKAREIDISEFIRKTREAISSVKEEMSGTSYHLGNVSMEFKYIPGVTPGVIYLPTPDDVLSSASQFSTIELEFETKQSAVETDTRTVQTPDLQHMTEIMARRKLAQAGLLTEVKYLACTNAIDKDKTIKQVPPPKAEITPNSTVTIFLGKLIEK